MALSPSRPPIQRVVAVSPASDRSDDLKNLASALNELDTEGLALTVLLVDNASQTPILPARLGFDDRTSVVRLDKNLGGSGGFNAGISAAVRSGADAVWLLDSDAKPSPDALRKLVEALNARQDASAAGSALADDNGVYEVGGDIRRSDGEYVQHPPGTQDVHEVGYNAACSLLVRSEAVRAAGLMPDLFLCGDDVAWCHLLRLSFGPILAVPTSVVRHPHPARMRTTVRAYQARNGLTNAVRFGLGPLARARRAFRDAGRAACQIVVGHDDLARLHMLGLRAAFDRPTGPIDAPPVTRWKPLTDLPQAHREPPGPRSKANAVAAVARWFLLPRSEKAVVNARAMPGAWQPAKALVTVCQDGYRETHPTRLRVATKLLSLGCETLVLAARAVVVPPKAPPPEQIAQDRVDTLSVVILTQPDRAERLKRTLSRLEPALAESRVRDHAREVVVVCNGGALDPQDLPDPGVPVRVVDLPQNLGVDGFNHGVRAASGDCVLILDDDAWPDPTSLGRALTRVRSDAADAVAFHRRHPRTQRFEWPGATETPPTPLWPDMGCCNLVRRDAWWSVGGYESGYFLYRNDTDLALSLLGTGRRVHFDPTIIAWHDSPTVGKQSAFWFRLATRNWVWLCRRHGRGIWAALGVFLGCAWSHARAGVRPSCHFATLGGLIAGLTTPPPALRSRARAIDGSFFGRLISLKVRLGRVGPTGEVRPDEQPTPAGEPLPAYSGPPAD